MLVFYIIISYLLASVSALAYTLFIKNKYSAIFQKNTLLVFISISLLMPLLYIQNFNIETYLHIPATHTAHSPAPVAEWVYNDFCPSQEQADLCYDVAIHETNFCHCTPLLKENIVLFKPNPQYEYFLTLQPYIYFVFKALLVFFSIILLLKIIYLQYIIKTSTKKSIKINQKKYTLLSSPKNYSFGSFQLFFTPYIIWQKNAPLQLAEKKATLWHEISHLQQKDTFIKIALHFIQILWCLNPAFYFFKNEITRLSEHIADDCAVAHIKNNKALYAQLLLKMNQFYGNKKQYTLYASLTEHPIKQRIKYIFAPPTPYKKLNAAAITLILILNTCAVFYTAYYFLHTQADKIKAYETLLHAQQQSGGNRTLFCKHCIANDNI